jgi:hypothetical protein
VDGGVEIVGDLIGVAVGAACPHFWHDWGLPFGNGIFSPEGGKKHPYIIADFGFSVKG